MQLDIYLDDDPVAMFNRTGDVTTSRQGLKIGFSVANFGLDAEDPCAPLVPRRGNFDWSLIHEFGHLRGFVDGTWPELHETFPDLRGDGEGYPEDDSPALTEDFVTIYSNLVFSEWDRIFKNQMATSAAIDRLVHHSVVLKFAVPSYRAAKAKSKTKASPRSGPKS